MSRNCCKCKSDKINIAWTLLYPSNPFYCQSEGGRGKTLKISRFARIKTPTL